MTLRLKTNLFWKFCTPVHRRSLRIAIRDRAPVISRPLLALRLARVLVDDFHRIRYPTLPAPNAALCMPGCPPRHACVAERRSLLTYLLTDGMWDRTNASHVVGIAYSNKCDS